MIVNSNDLDRLKYLEREIKNTHFKKVITSIINNIQVNNKIYVISEDGAWDYESSHYTTIHTTFKDALEEYKLLVNQSRHNMNEWTDASEEDEQIDEDSEGAKFEIWEDGDYTRLHDVIRIEKREVK